MVKQPRLIRNKNPKIKHNPLEKFLKKENKPSFKITSIFNKPKDQPKPYQNPFYHFFKNIKKVDTKQEKSKQIEQI